jgi:hypothetical protein
MQKQDKQSLIQSANKLLARNGFAVDGTPKKTFSKGQRFFERRIIGTPMGNGMR